MRFTLRSTCFLAVILCHIKFSFETKSSVSSNESEKSHRTVIDGTRGSKYYDPAEDDYLDDYIYDESLNSANVDKLVLEDIRRNVPGEPGVDYPAFQRLPRTSFSCEGRPRGYYADEEARCQLFHVCDAILVSSFLCPVGSIFSQKLLTCDWWNKVNCSLTSNYYEANRHIYDQDDDEMLRKAYAMTDFRGDNYEQKSHDGNPNLDERIGNDLPNSYDDIIVDPDYRSYAHFDNQNERYRGHVIYSNDFRTRPSVNYHDSPIVRIHKLTDGDIVYARQSQQQRRKNPESYHESVDKMVNHFQPSYAPTVPTVTTTTRRYYSPTVPIMFKSTTPSYQEQSSKGSFYRDNPYFQTPNPIGQVRNVDVTNYSQNKESRNDDYESNFYETMELRESIGLAQSKDERSKDVVEKTQNIKEGNQKENTTSQFANERTKNLMKVEGTVKAESSIKAEDKQENTTLSPPVTSYSDIVVQYHSTRGVKLLLNNPSTDRSRDQTTEQTTKSFRSTMDVSLSSSTARPSSTFKPIVEYVSEPAKLLEPPETDLGFPVKVPQNLSTEEQVSVQKSTPEFSTIEYNPHTSPSRTGSFDRQENLSGPIIDYPGKYTTLTPLPVSHLPTINIPATEIIPPFQHLFAGGHYGTYPTTDGAVTENNFYHESENNTSDEVSNKPINETEFQNIVIPGTELQPPVYNHKDEHDSFTDDYDSSRETENISTEDTFNTTEQINDYAEKSVEISIENEDFKPDHSDEEKSNDFKEIKEETEATTRFSLSNQDPFLLKIMAELAKTNRFPRPFTHNEPLDINIMSTSPDPDPYSHIISFAKNQRNSNRHEEIFDYPVYRGEDHFEDINKTINTVSSTTSNPETVSRVKLKDENSTNESNDREQKTDKQKRNDEDVKLYPLLIFF